MGNKEEKMQEDNTYQTRRKVVLALSTLIVLALFGWVTFYVGKPLVKLASNPELFRQWIDSHGIWGRLVFLGIQVLQVVVAMIPGEVIEIGAGYAFGAVEGTLLCLVGVAIGSAIIFLLTRKIGARFTELLISREKIAELKWMNSSKKLNQLVFIVFFIPGTPKDLLTYFVGLTPIKLRDFIIISSIARIPSLVSSTFGGHALGDKDYLLAFGIFAITGLVSAGGMWLYNRIIQHKNTKNSWE